MLHGEFKKKKSETDDMNNMKRIYLTRGMFRVISKNFCITFISSVIKIIMFILLVSICVRHFRFFWRVIYIFWRFLLQMFLLLCCNRTNKNKYFLIVNIFIHPIKIGLHRLLSLLLICLLIYWRKKSNGKIQN